MSDVPQHNLHHHCIFWDLPYQDDILDFYQWMYIKHVGCNSIPFMYLTRTLPVYRDEITYSCLWFMAHLHNFLTWKMKIHWASLSLAALSSLASVTKPTDYSIWHHLCSDNFSTNMISRIFYHWVYIKHVSCNNIPLMHLKEWSEFKPYVWLSQTVFFLYKKITSVWRWNYLELCLVDGSSS